MTDVQGMDAARRRLIVALDVADAAAALTAARRLEGHVGMLKVGLELFVAEGPEVVRYLRRELPGLEIFLDLKLHDIPNTMRGAIRSARALGARFITVHAGSGVAHLRACVEEAGPQNGVLAVIDTICARVSFEPPDYAALGVFILGHTRQPDRAYPHFARAVQTTPDPAFARGLVDYLRREGQADWADRLQASRRAVD